MLYEILASVTHNSHYLTKYITFISNCQRQNESYTEYTEQHHICPRAMFPEFVSFIEFPWNCAKLTLRQHYIAHLLLYKSYPSVDSQALAVYLMANTRDIKVNSKLYAKLKLQAVKASKGKIIVKDLEGRTSQVDNTDPRYLSGELVGVVKGKVTVRDSKGNTLQVDTTDTRFLSGELEHVNKRKITAKDANGNTTQVSLEDPRYLLGELVHIRKDVPPINRGLTAEQVMEIRLADKDPSSVITNEYITNVVKKSQKNKVGKIPITDLRYGNGYFVTYKSLLVKYYADKFKIRSDSIKDVLDGKSYKEIDS